MFFRELIHHKTPFLFFCTPLGDQSQNLGFIG
jgi:hypothetical protein